MAFNWLPLCFFQQIPPSGLKQGSLVKKDPTHANTNLDSNKLKPAMVVGLKSYDFPQYQSSRATHLL